MRSTTWRLLRLASPFAGWIALASLLGAATVGSGVGLMATASFLIASAALHPSIADLMVPIVGVRFFGVFRGVLRYLERYVSHSITFRLLARIRVWFYSSLEPLAPARLLQHRSGDLLSRAVSDVEELQHFYVRAVAPPLVALIVTVAVFVFVWSFDLGLALVLVAFLLLSGVGVSVVTGWLGQGLGRQAVRVRAELNSQLVDGIQGMPDLLVYRQDQRHLKSLRELARTWRQVQDSAARVSGLHAALTSFLMLLGVWTMLILAIPLVTTGRLEGVYLPVLAMAAMASFEAVAQLPAAIQHWESCRVAAQRLFGIVDAQPAVRDPDTASPQPKSYDLTVQHLRLRYDEDGAPALDGVSLTLPEGGALAIVGPSGAGKSSLAHVLLRFWDYEEGTILLGGHDLRSYRRADLSRMITMVSQRTHLFNGTIKDNLLVACPNASMDQIEQAAGRAQLDRFVRTLPEGYDTWVGERGLRLSGGERQRLAIARALLRDAPILILDEATANLDSLVEREIIASIQALMEGRTTLIITHRLVGLEAVDEIVVLREGRVIERGQHLDLLQRNGYYRRMWDLQEEALLEGIA